MLHINVPGARGRLTDPGNGTTDFAFMASNAFVVDSNSRDTYIIRIGAFWMRRDCHI